MPDKMHIAIITTSYPGTMPGSEAAGSFVEDFAIELSKYAKVTVIAPGMENSLCNNQKLTIYYFSVPRLPLSLLKPGKISHWPFILRTLKAGRDALTTVAQDSQIDHIFALWVLPSGYWARNIQNKFGTPYSTWALGSDIWSLKQIPIIKQVLRKVLKASQHSFADGLALKSDVESLSGKPCDFLPSSRHLDTNTPPEKHTKPPYRLTYIGRWHPNKGVDLLLDSLASLNKNDWQKIQKIVICGGGPLEAQVKQRCQALIKDGRPIVLNGFIDKRTASQLLKDTDYLLIPSRIESIPVIFSDALQSNCPVISTPAGDLISLINKHHVGFVSNELSAESFSSAIKKALNTDPTTFSAALDKAKHLFSLEASVKQFLMAVQS